VTGVGSVTVGVVVTGSVTGVGSVTVGVVVTGSVTGVGSVTVGVVVTGSVAGVGALQPLIAHAVDTASSEMSAVFAAPRWLRDLGIASWLLVGAALVVVMTSVIALAQMGKPAIPLLTDALLRANYRKAPQDSSNS
jgi:hypothetical protein